MARVIEQNGTLIREALAPRIEINWQPGDTGAAILHYVEELRLNGELLTTTPARMVALPLQDLLDRTVEVEIEPGVFHPVPMRLVMGAIKTLVDQVWDETAHQEPGA